MEEKAPEIEENFRYLKKLKFLNESQPQDSLGFENEEEGSEIWKSVNFNYKTFFSVFNKFIEF